MYHAIIADDEENALDELLYVIDWQKENVAIDAVAGDGEEAVKLIEKFRPDFILCDINMPKKSGIDVLRFLKSGGYPSLFIAVSAYSDFHYVRECLDNGAFTYLLKTVDREELLSVLARAKKQTDEIKHKKNDEQYKNALFALMSNNDCLQHLKDLGFQPTFPFFTLIKSRGNFLAETQRKKDVSSIVLPCGREYLLLLNHQKGYAAESSFGAVPCGISSSSPHLGRLYYEADCAFLSEKFFQTPLNRYRKTDPALIKLLSSKIAEARSTDDIAALLKNSLCGVNELCALYNLFTDSKKEDSLSYFDFGNQFDSLHDFARFLKNYDRSENVLDIEEVTERIHGYIALNYAQNISVNMLSEKFFVSPGYLNRSFKKKYGITINKFITDVRMNKAMELINSANNLTLLKISQMVGYSDFYYFSRVFKKNFERAPSFYKNQ